jgi:hypothetical protein
MTIIIKICNGGINVKRSDPNKLIQYCKRMESRISQLLFKHYMAGKLDLASLQDYRILMDAHNRNIVELEKRATLPFFKGANFSRALSLTTELLLEIAEDINSGNYSRMDEQLASMESR